MFELRSSGGSAFQQLGQDTANALGPIVLVIHAGTLSRPVEVPAERS